MKEPLTVVMPIRIGKNCYIADTAVLIGDVTIGDDVAIFDHVVLRGDLNKIMVGNGSNIQDNVTFHTEINHGTSIGEGVSVGHNAVVHGCELMDNIIVGMGAIVMNGSKIPSGCVIAAGAVVTENFICRENSLIAGLPAKVKREADPLLLEYAKRNAQSYGVLREKHLAGDFSRETGKTLKGRSAPT